MSNYTEVRSAAKAGTLAVVSTDGHGVLLLANDRQGWAAFHQAFGLPANMTDEMVRSVACATN